MGRSTFEGPVLAGDNRFGPLRNVGYVGLNQSANLLLTNTTANTATYGGASGIFVDSNGIPNSGGDVYTPSTAFPPTLQTIPADTATNWYRGFVAYLPAGSRIVNMLVDVQALVTVTGTLSSQTVYISNNYTAAAGTPTYGATGAISAVGRQSLSAFTATQLANQQSTSTDIIQTNGEPNISQVVFTIAIVGTTVTAITAGQYIFTVQYTQADGNIGSTTAYPYGNFD